MAEKIKWSNSNCYFNIKNCKLELYLYILNHKTSNTCFSTSE